MTARGKTWVAVPLALLALAGCGGGDEKKPAAKPKASAAAPVVRKPTTQAPEEAAQPVAGGDGGAPMIAFQESDFTENDRSRDPFRSFAKKFEEEAKVHTTGRDKPVILRQYSLDELRLVGIVTRMTPAKAMLVDPTGKGHVIQRGQFIGRPEVVQGPSGSSASYEVNWRVDSIREGDIVLVREDPSNPDVPSATRVIPLRPEGENVQTEETPEPGAAAPAN